MDAKTNLLEYQVEIVNCAAKYVSDCCSRLCKMCESTIVVTDELEHKFYLAVKDIDAVKLGVVPRSHGSFVVENGIVTFDLQTFIKIIEIVYIDIAAEATKSGRYLEKNEIVKLAMDVFLVYFLHEIRHRQQGIELYSSVQTLKRTGGEFMLGLLDLLADRDAMFAFAMIKSEGADRHQYLEKFNEALFYNINYFLKLFDFSDKKPEKTARAVSLILMTARVAKSMEKHLKIVEENVPLDAPLYISWNANHAGMAVFRLEPNLTYIGHSVSNDNEALVASLRKGDFHSALKSGVRILDAVGL